MSRKFHGEQQVVFMQKPYRVTEVSGKLREVLAYPAGLETSGCSGKPLYSLL